MSHTISAHTLWEGLGAFVEHAAVVFAGLVLMIAGLGLGVTVIMLPVGIVIGLIGVLMVVAGLFVRLRNDRTEPELFPRPWRKTSP